MKNNHEKEIKMNDSIINENEKFFTELATAYVKKDGEEIRARDTLQASKLSTGNLDKKMKWRMKRRDEKSRRTRRNRMAMLSAVAACFFMFIVYYAVSPMFLRQDFPAPAGMEGVYQFFAPEAALEAEPEAEPETEWDVVEAPAQEMVDEVADLLVEVEEEVLEVVEEEIVFVAEDRDELNLDELLSFVCVLGVRDSREYFERALPDGYRITGMEYYEYSTDVILISATNHSIELRESHRALPGELMRMGFYGEAEHHTIDIEGIEVAQLVLVDTDSRDYLLHLQATDRYFTVVGSELDELIAVARALIHLPELDFDGAGLDGTIFDTGADIVEEIMNNMRLPRGLVTLVPIP